MKKFIVILCLLANMNIIHAAAPFSWYGEESTSLEYVSDIVKFLQSENLDFLDGHSVNEFNPIDKEMDHKYVAVFGQNADVYITCITNSKKTDCSWTTNGRTVHKGSPKWLNQIKELVEKYEKSKASK